MSWAAFWDADNTIYVSDRHRERHYRAVARSIAALVNAPTEVVLDFGCGEALSADLVAERCARLYLCESAPSVRARLSQRYADRPIVIVDETLAAVPAGSVDLLVANSIVQYVSLAELPAILALWRSKLSPSGRLVVADVLPRRGSALQEALSLLHFAASEGFFMQALLGLARTSFSSYPRLRRELGLLRFDEAEMMALLRKAGFAPKRVRNLGHNQQRMAFLAMLSVGETSSPDAQQSSS